MKRIELWAMTAEEVQSPSGLRRDDQVVEVGGEMFRRDGTIVGRPKDGAKLQADLLATQQTDPSSWRSVVCTEGGEFVRFDRSQADLGPVETPQPGRLPEGELPPGLVEDVLDPK